MTTEPFTLEARDGVLSGPVRRPVNLSRDAAGSIHDDATAQTLGFRGGTVAGNIHFEQFPPLMLARFGEDWRRRGGLSLYFLHATTDGEPVQAFVGAPETLANGVRRASAWMETPEGVRVCEGTAWAGGEDPDSALRRRVAQQKPATDLRILRASKVGDTVRDIPSRLDSATALRRLEGVTEPLPEYRDAALFGGLVAAPAVAIDALRAVEKPLFPTDGDYVGMFGAIELEFLDGPVFLDRDYRVDGRVLALGESPKTEVTWYESTLREAQQDRPVARLVMMSRLLKASSALWT
ncbi:MAG: hypothetical protein IM662_08420 [Phenylobacterium sp.]|jgi:hypothetical protein|uniref:hypothetical protein n=1 Tax=Phenylobacterium sp. TaxID=1871053 RepID=UPI0025F3DF2E|nr:hypothetical protein [Phenylobacterium sp.]MCA3731257.1 hypothetical protein [Phenylobacterium sp.]MCA6272990.1 hypothetical protein [Phenylobacterium sp.]MCA6277766.1 hypothetical protein [Phenylobacterium sp.]MCA6320673.1 hypothetical protein [Phenylobacterium sp.]